MERSNTYYCCCCRCCHLLRETKSHETSSRSYSENDLAADNKQIRGLVWRDNVCVPGCLLFVREVGHEGELK